MVAINTLLAVTAAVLSTAPTQTRWAAATITAFARADGDPTPKEVIACKNVCQVFEAPYDAKQMACMAECLKNPPGQGNPGNGNGHTIVVDGDEVRDDESDDSYIKVLNKIYIGNGTGNDDKPIDDDPTDEYNDHDHYDETLCNPTDADLVKYMQKRCMTFCEMDKQRPVQCFENCSKPFAKGFNAWLKKLAYPNGGPNATDPNEVIESSLDFATKTTSTRRWTTTHFSLTSSKSHGTVTATATATTTSKGIAEVEPRNGAAAASSSKTSADPFVPLPFSTVTAHSGSKTKTTKSKTRTRSSKTTSKTTTTSSSTTHQISPKATTTKTGTLVARAPGSSSSCFMIGTKPHHTVPCIDIPPSVTITRSTRTKTTKTSATVDDTTTATSSSATSSDSDHIIVTITVPTKTHTTKRPTTLSTLTTPTTTDTNPIAVRSASSESDKPIKCHTRNGLKLCAMPAPTMDPDAVDGPIGTDFPDTTTTSHKHSLLTITVTRSTRTKSRTITTKTPAVLSTTTTTTTTSADTSTSTGSDSSSSSRKETSTTHKSRTHQSHTPKTTTMYTASPTATSASLSTTGLSSVLPHTVHTTTVPMSGLSSSPTASATTTLTNKDKNNMVETPPQYSCYPARENCPPKPPKVPQCAPGRLSCSADDDDD